jgi:hypothetical protein
MSSIFWEIQPTEKGTELSWLQFLLKKIIPASKLEIKTGFTVLLTDAISNVLAISKSIDPTCNMAIEIQKGLMFPTFTLSIYSKKFEISAEKIFAGGSNRESVFNYRVDILINSSSSEIIKLFQKSLNELGPKPLSEKIVLA